MQALVEGRLVVASLADQVQVIVREGFERDAEEFFALVGKRVMFGQAMDFHIVRFGFIIPPGMSLDFAMLEMQWRMRVGRTRLNRNMFVYLAFRLARFGVTRQYGFQPALFDFKPYIHPHAFIS